MTIFVYVLWIIIPSFFFCVAIWSKLEQLSGKQKRDNPGDFFRQGIFILICVGISVVVDKFFLTPVVAPIIEPGIPIWAPQVILLPCILYLASLIVGPAGDIRISKAPNPTQRKRGR